MLQSGSLWFWSCALLFGCVHSKGVKNQMDQLSHFEFLEEVEGKAALDWVHAQNAKTVSVLESDKNYLSFLASANQILNATDRIAYAQYRGGLVYNFWQDEQHVRGILRQTSLDQYISGKPTWQTILDVDRLAKDENENWVYKGSICLEPDYTRCLIRLSRGGTDASVLREFTIGSLTNGDVASSESGFVKDGFYIPEAKSGVAWIDENTLLLGTNWGEGTLTASGYPRQARIWSRGEPLEKARLIFEGRQQDVGVWSSTFEVVKQTDGQPEVIPAIIRSKTFFTTEVYVVMGQSPIRLPLPDTVEPRAVFKDQLLVSLRKPWRVEAETYPIGSLLAIPFWPLVNGDLSEVKLVWRPNERSSLEQVSVTRHALYVLVLENVKSRLYRYRLDGLAFTRETVDLPGAGTARIVSAYPTEDKAFVNFESFTTPDQLSVIDDTDSTLRLVSTLPDRFDASGTHVQQFTATSADGEQIPYFLVTPKGFQYDGSTPTLLYGYGGFEISLTPNYRATYGKLWLARGGAYVIANIRGGGEFGPRWHQAALKENRQRAFDDFAAVAEDLIARKVTSSTQLGIAGGSNGGLLVGATFTQKPELFNAVVCQVPLLDMLRYTKLLAGASWVAEYGDPDDESMRTVLESYSPLHNLEAGRPYPKVFFVTSTRDDRVHPAHARKMAARMIALGYPVYYFENVEGGHSGAANLKQTARRIAYEFVYLSRQLALP